MRPPLKYELIIVGAGLVGSSLMIAVQNSDLKILCLDRKALSMQQSDVADQRPISLSYASVNILKNLKLWDELAGLAAPIHKVHISTQGGFGHLQFRAADYELPALGYVVPFAVLERSLQQRAMQNLHVGFLEVQSIAELAADEEGARLRVTTAAGEEFLEADLLVGADGTHSRVRELLGLVTETQACTDKALTARIQLQKPHAGIAFERFTPDGTFALLPTWDKHVANLVWTLNHEQWELVQHKNPTELLAKIQSVFGYRLGKMRNLEVMGHYPLHSITTKTTICPGAVLIGNAAHSFYPLAAQGFNLGSRDAATLAEVLLEAKQQGKKLGSLPLLEKYQSYRAVDQQAVQNLTHNLHQVFSINVPGVNALRSMVLLGIDLITPVKNNFAKRCLGFAGRVARLARGHP